MGTIGTADPNPANSYADDPYADDPPGRSARARPSQTARPPAAEHLRLTGYELAVGAVVAVAGELDIASAPLLAWHLSELASRLRTRVVLDLAALDFCDCAGLSVLLRAHRRDAASGGWLRLCRPKPTIQRTLRITKFTRVLVCYPNVAAAFLDP